MHDHKLGQPSAVLNRRDVLRRGAILGGALAWTVPAVQTLSGPAFAVGSPCIGRFQYSDGAGQCLYVQYRSDDTCCDCITTTSAQLASTLGGSAAEFVVVAGALCQVGMQCRVESSGAC